MKSDVTRWIWLAIGSSLLLLMVVMGWLAPDELSPINTVKRCGVLKDCTELPFQNSVLGTDALGRPLLEYVMQGAYIITIPAIVSGLFVSLLAAFAGLARCASLHWVDTVIQAFSELVGALPRIAVILVIAIIIPREWRGLSLVGLAWAVMAAPGAMDEAAACAGRLGGARFVEALKAHGFSAFRIYGYHVAWLNLKSVLVRQAAEVAMQVMFLEISLSYLARQTQNPAFTHSDSHNSWARLLYYGYTSIMRETYNALHAMALGLILIGLMALMFQAFRIAARER